MKNTENIKEDSTTKKFRLPPSIIMLIIAAIALVIGVVVPPILAKYENQRIDEDCKTASTILEAVKVT